MKKIKNSTGRISPYNPAYPIYLGAHTFAHIQRVPQVVP